MRSKTSTNAIVLISKTNPTATGNNSTTIRNKVTTLLRNAKTVFVQSATTDTTHNARLHHIMKCLKQKTATPIPDLHHLPHEATTAQDKANMFNRFFIQQSEQSVTDSPPTTPPIRTTPDITSTLHTITTSPAEVESLLKQLNTKEPRTRWHPNTTPEGSRHQFSPLPSCSVQPPLSDW